MRENWCAVDHAAHENDRGVCLNGCERKQRTNPWQEIDGVLQQNNRLTANCPSLYYNTKALRINRLVKSVSMDDVV